MQKFLFLALGCTLGVLIGWIVSTSPAPSALNEGTYAFEELEIRLLSTRANFERLQPPTSAEENALRRPETPPYRNHLDIADSLGVEPVTGEEDLSRRVRRRELIPLVENEYYTVMTLEHSAPFITPALGGLLDEIGRRFQEGLDDAGLPMYRYTISSATRTADLQEDLRVGNRNAAPGTSSHEFGISVDIVIFRYDHDESSLDQIQIENQEMSLEINSQLAEMYRAYGGLYWDHLFGLMTRVLDGLQREGRVLVLLEAEQPVFHITVTQ